MKNWMLLKVVTPLLLRWARWKWGDVGMYYVNMPLPWGLRRFGGEPDVTSRMLMFQKDARRLTVMVVGDRYHLTWSVTAPAIGDYPTWAVT